MDLRERQQVDGAAGPVDADRLAGLDAMARQERRIGAALRRAEAIAEAFVEPVLRRVVGIDRYRPPHRHPERPKIVDAVYMVGMGMGVDDGVDARHAGADQLRAEVRPGVDQDARRLRRRRRSARSVPTQRLRRLRGSFGSQAPQSPVIRGTPGDAPQPRMVKRRRAMRSIRRAGTLVNRRKKFVGRRLGDFLRRKRPEPPPEPSPFQQHRTARCGCRDAASAQGTAHRFRPEDGRPGYPPRSLAARRSS